MLGGVADRRTARFGVYENSECHIKIGSAFDVYMTVSGTGFDCRYLRIFCYRAYQSFAAARYEQVDVSLCFHQRCCGHSGCVGHELDGVGRNSAFFERFFYYIRNGGV